MLNELGKIGEFRKKPYKSGIICPRCGVNLLPTGYPGALSRVDNKTEICSPCGTDEGLRDFIEHHLPSTEEWPVKIKFELNV